jgi:transcriptional regulator with XRE-family HTH domain
MTDQDLNKAIGNRITSIRKRADLTQQDMADKLGITKIAYQRIESGAVVIPAVKVVAISEVLGKEVSVFFTFASKLGVIATMEGGGV